MTDRRLAVAALVVSAFAFGLAYPIVSQAVGTFPPLGLVAWRFAIGAAALLSLSFPTQGRLWRDGSVAGIWLFGGYTAQALALDQGDAWRVASIGALGFVLAPLVLAGLTRLAPSPWVIVAGVMGFAGMILLALGDSFDLQRSDLLALTSAAAFAGHLIHLALTARRHVVVPFTGVQLLVASALGFIVSLAVDGPTLPSGPSLAAVIGTGLGIGGACFLAQVWAQGRLGTATTSLVVATVPVFAVVASVVLLDERPTGTGWLGALVLSTATLVVTFKGHDPDLAVAQSITAGH